MPLRSLSEAYSVLEIHATATESEIKSSYKRLALKTHPDKNLNDPHASVKFQQITEAFQMVTSRLSGEREYSRYDGDYDVDSEEFEEDDEDFNLFDDEKFARDLFNFIFSGKDGGKSFFFKFMNKTPCQCASCMDAKREQQDREEYRAFQAAKEKKQAESASKRPENFDPHANWLSDDEGDGAVKRSGMARGTKKQSKKKKGKQKVKKNSAVKKKKAAQYQYCGECADNDSSGDSDDGDNESEPDSGGSDPHTKSAAATPVRPSVHHPTPVSNKSSHSFRSGSSSAQTTPSAATTAGSASSVNTTPSADTTTESTNTGTKSSARTPSSTNSTLHSTPSSDRSSSTTGSSGTNSSSKGSGGSGVSGGGSGGGGDGKRSGYDHTMEALSSTASSPEGAVRSKAAPTAGASTNGPSTTTMPTLEGVPLCRTFLTKHGNCKYGDSCCYSHGGAPGTAAAGHIPFPQSPAAQSAARSGGNNKQRPPQITATRKPSTPTVGSPSPHSSRQPHPPRQAAPKNNASTAAAMAMAAAQASLRAEMSPRHFQSSSKQTTASAQKASSAVAEPAVTVQMKGKVTAGGKEQDQGQERVCAFYGSEKGCRFGDKCRFQHNDAR